MEDIKRPSREMAPAPHDIDLASLVPDITDALGADTPPASSSPTAGFTLHKATMGKETVLVKVFSGLPQGCLPPEESRIIAKAFLEELGRWKQIFYSIHFGVIIGRSIYVDSILACPVYPNTTVAKEYLKEVKEINLLGFMLHIAQGVEFLHEKNVAHGDIRADNILVGKDGLPRILDYGLSRIIDLLNEHGLRDKTDVNAAARWMPPEFMEDDVYKSTREGDIWSLGMTIYELWSGNMPYRGTSLVTLPSKIIRGQLPEFPGGLKPGVEAIREQVKFMCNLCWHRNPADRVTASGLVYILRSLFEGKDLSHVRWEFDSRRSQHPTQMRRMNASPPAMAGSISSSDTSSLPDASSTHSISVQSVVSPYDGSDSGYDTATEQGRPPRVSVKVEESDEDSYLRHASPLAGRGARGNGRSHAFGTTGDGRAHEQASPKQEQGSSHGRPFSAFPRPPSPDSSLNSVNSYMTALLNYKAKHKISTMNITREFSGEAHQLMWTTVCTINGRVYGRATEPKTKSADDKAAREALNRLNDENPSLASDMAPTYLSTFNSYLKENGLTHRIDMVCHQEGEAHCPVWLCRLLRDGELLATGVATKREKAREEAARQAAKAW